MEHLAFEDGLRLSELSARAGMTPQSMGQLVDELEDLGYVERRPDPSDRRAKRIHLTPKGKGSNQTEWKVVQEVEDALVQLLGEKRLNDLRASLLQIHGHRPRGLVANRGPRMDPSLPRGCRC